MFLFSLKITAKSETARHLYSLKINFGFLSFAVNQQRRTTVGYQILDFSL
jgi:hypothetical protein